MNSNQTIKRIGGCTFVFFSVLLSTPALAQECLVSGETLRLAAQKYNKQCAAPRKDCDKIRGVWYCSSGVINANRLTVTELLQPSASVVSTPEVVSRPQITLPEVQNIQTDSNLSGGAAEGNVPVPVNNVPGCIDTDGDGWGWNGTASCKLAASGSLLTSQTNTIGIDPVSASICVDSDGDGWGWNGVASCRTATKSYAVSDGVISGSVISGSVVSEIDSRFLFAGTESTVPENCEKIDSGDYHITQLVTDVVLTAGQSNATGDGTVYDPARYRQDRVNSRVIAWTENNRWEVADPASHTWHDGLYPSGKGKVSNHPAFQIGRAMANQDNCRVVAVIATAASGMPINHWLHNVDGHYSYISNKVTNAINALPGKHQIDMLWWMQGEADNDEIVSRYFYKLNQLIGMFRAESWFAYNGYFLANETRRFPFANEAIRMLRGDDSPYTDYSRGENKPGDLFPAKAGEEVHYSATSLRKIGDLVAHKYLWEHLVVKD